VHHARNLEYDCEMQQNELHYDHDYEMQQNELHYEHEVVY
jgi:hypothetical protein